MGFKKLEELQGLIKREYRYFSNKNLLRVVSRITKHGEGYRATLNTEERTIKHIILKYGYKPRTALYWLRGTQLPSYLKIQVMNGELSLSKAFQLERESRFASDESIKEKILKEIRSYIYSIEDQGVGK